MIRHQDNKIIYNELVSFSLSSKMRIDPHPETCPSKDELHLVAPDGSFKLVIAFLTTEKSAKEFTEEIYEERADVRITGPLCEIETANGIKGWATQVVYDNAEVEEITLDLPGEHHSLLNLHFWHLEEPFNEMLYTLTKREILKSVRLLQDTPSQPVEEAERKKDAQGRDRQSDPIAYTKIIYLPHATVRVKFPDISEKERKRRIKRVEEALIAWGKAEMRIEQEERERKEREEQDKQQE